MLPKNVLYYGKEEPLPDQVALRAGPLSLIYEEGDLRYIKLGDHEILRRLYVAIRDRNWGTVLPVLSNLQMDIGEDSFRISYDVENKESINEKTKLLLKFREVITPEVAQNIIGSLQNLLANENKNPFREGEEKENLLDCMGDIFNILHEQISNPVSLS